MHTAFQGPAKIATMMLVFALSAAASVAPENSVAAAQLSSRLSGHVPASAIAAAKSIGPLQPNTTLSLALALPLRNQPELDDLLRRLYDPADPLYGQFLTPDEFTARFGPLQADYDAVTSYARAEGLRVTGTHPNRLLLDVSGSAGVVESAFKLHLLSYQDRNGRQFYAPDNDPEVPASVVPLLQGIIGLDNAAVWHPHSRGFAASQSAVAAPLQIGTGPGGGLAPTDIRTAYDLDLDSLGVHGTGQTLGLFELTGYSPTDITGYEKYYRLPAVPLQNVLVDGFSGKPGSGADEVTLDIELMIALAPGASKIIVYEGQNTSAGVVDTYHRIATDNLAKQISTSWGLSETSSSPAVLNGENSAFEQMAAQGQSIYAASGDSGALDNGSTLSVDDPASQPYMVGVGGTQLFVNPGETYNHETTWNNGTVSGGASGGGVSAVWSIPTWQEGIVSAASATMRNVPDVSLNADQYTGYSIYYKNGWWIYGGTSCAAPLWAAFTALANEQRGANGQASLGFANPALYPLAEGTNYASDFHDIADDSTNLYYHAVTGYDNATGWGSFVGAYLLADLAPLSASPTKPLPPTNLTATAGDATVTLHWTASSGATSYSVYRGMSSGGEGTTPFTTGITATTYTDSTLTNGTIYYYTVTASNGAGESAPSNEVSATPTAAPVLSITAGPTASPSRKSATIQWTTNLASTSVVRYGKSAGKLTTTVSSSGSVTAHAVNLTGLKPLTTYYYQVSSTAETATVSSAVFSFKTTS